MLRGDLGQPPGGWPPAFQAKALKGGEAYTQRPGALLPPADLAAARRETETRIGRQISDEELASSLMYPKVFADFAAAQRKYGPVSILPTPVFFYGMQTGDELSVEIERGKSLLIRLQTIGDADEDGFRRVFFELNGQPRIIKVPDRGVARQVTARAKADPANPAHVAAPMPGLVTSIAVQAGQKVAMGDPLLVIEAMKMETTLAAEREGVIATVAVKPGQQIDAKDLLITYQ
jgi:pyruvate carboxylase